MKLSKYIFLLVLGCLLSNCEDILDKEDLTAVNEDEVWNDLQLATAYVNEIYDDNLPGWSSSEADISDESNGGGDYMYGHLTENSVNYWPYDNIRNVNILLANIDEGTLEEADKNKLKGEAIFFRAWRYFELAKRYGGVPLILEPQKITDDLLVKRDATSDIFTQIVSDLDDAIAYLPEIDASAGENDGHVHKGTAMAVKGRVLLFWASPEFNPDNAMDRWQAAYDANKGAKEYLEAHGFGLYEDFANLWFDEMNKEAIFVQRYEYPVHVSNWAAGTRPLDVSQNNTGDNWPVLEMVRSFPMKDGRAIDDPASAYTYDEDYYWQNRDPRFKATIAYNGTLWELQPVGSGRIEWTYVGAESNNPTLTGFYTRKAVDINQNASEASNSDTDWIELRFAEVLLNLAEAANAIGNTDEAYAQLEAIRARAGIDPGASDMYGLDAGMGQDQMLDAIMLERKIEFAYEGKRYWDLRRRKLYEELLNGTRRHGYTIELKVSEEEWNNLKESMSSQELIDYLNVNYTDYFQNTETVLDTEFDINWQENYYFYAIPSEHLQLNSNLEQTAGWPGGTFDPLR